MSFSQAYIGEVRALPYKAGRTPPGWIPCDGRLLAISEYTALFAVIETRFGGDGRATFAMPDLRGRVPVGCGWGQNQAFPRVGDSFGDEAVRLEPSELARHHHMMASAKLPAHSSSPAEGRPAISSAPIYAAPEGKPITQLPPDTLAVTGQGVHHDNMSPSLALHFCIAYQGIFPAPD